MSWIIDHLHKKDYDNNDEIMRKSPIDHTLVQFESARRIEKIICESDYHRSPDRNGKEEKVSFLPLWVGDKGIDIYNTFPVFSAKEKKRLKPQLDNFLAYVQTKLKPIFTRY